MKVGDKYENANAFPYFGPEHDPLGDEQRAIHRASQERRNAELAEKRAYVLLLRQSVGFKIGTGPRANVFPYIYWIPRKAEIAALSEEVIRLRTRKHDPAYILHRRALNRAQFQYQTLPDGRHTDLRKQLRPQAIEGSRALSSDIQLRSNRRRIRRYHFYRFLLRLLGDRTSLER